MSAVTANVVVGQPADFHILALATAKFLAPVTTRQPDSADRRYQLTSEEVTVTQSIAVFDL